MTDFPGTDGDLGDEVLSAYLSGDLDASEEAAVEERLARDPALAARLDRLAEVVGALRGLDAVEPPTGFRERLDRRLTAEQAPEVTDLDRARAARRRPRWSMVGLATAALVIVAVGAAGLLQSLAGFSADEAADAPLARTQDVPQAETFADGGADAPAAGEPAPDAGADAGRPEGAEPEAAAPEAAPDDRDTADPGPEAPDEQADTATVVVRDDAVPLPDAVTIRRRYRNVPEASALLGASRARADGLAAAARTSLDAADVSPGGVPANACIDAVERAVGPPAVVVLVESAVTPQGPALAHVVVSADGQRLDRVDALLLDPAGCAPIDRVTVTGAGE